MPVQGTTLTSFRPLMQGANGMVVASHPSAAMAGLDVLRNGGNAIDAGVAVGLALNVVHVDDCSFLGVAPTVMYLADRKEVVEIDGLGVWPQAASVEYFKAVHEENLIGPVITPVFKEVKSGVAKVLGMFAKRARGAMARYIIKNRLESPEQLKSFDADGYAHRPDLSEGNTWVFTRDNG